MAVDNSKKVLPRIVPAADSYHMGMLFMYAAACRDPLEQRAARIVDTTGLVLGEGVNHMPQKDHMATNWKERRLLVLAEEMAVDRAITRRQMSYDLAGATIYLTGPLSVRGYRRIFSSGIKSIIYGPQVAPDYDEEEFKDVATMAKEHYVTLKAFEGNVNWLRDRLLRLEETLF